MTVKLNLKQLLKTTGKVRGSSDGFFLVERAADTVFAICRGKVRHPRLYAVLNRFIRENGPSFDDKNIVRLLSAFQEKHPVTYKMAEEVSAYLFLIALKSISDQEKAADDRVYGDALKLIRSTFALDTESLFPVLEAERILLTDGIYSISDGKTKAQCREKVSLYARKKHITERDAAAMLKDRLFDNVLPWQSRFYYPLIIALTLTFCGLMLASGFDFFLVLFSVCPISEAVKYLCDFFCSKTVKVRSLPRLELSHIPDDAKTLVVITALMTENNGKELLRNLEEYYCANRDKNARFGILGDLADSDREFSDTDEKILRDFEHGILELNEKYGNVFCLFTRPRQYSPSEKRFMGWERKRGAVLQLTNLICGKDNGFSRVIADNCFLGNVKYIVTLDSDTRLYPGALSDMVSAIAHPANRPIVRNGRVVRGYGVFQPRMETSLSSAFRTPFTVLQSSGGSDIYGNAAYETYQSVFGEGIFCGKGIFDVSLFNQMIDGAFPDGIVLSHDLLEGSRLRAAALTDVPLSDTVPQNPISYFKRMHRWIRGDVQSLAFAGRKVRNAAGEKIKNPISLLSVLKITDNLRRELVPVFALLTLVLAVISRSSHLLCLTGIVFAYLLLPLSVSVLTLLSTSFRKFYSLTVPGLLRSFCQTVWRLMSMPYQAFITCDALWRSIWRMNISKTKLLEWVTADSADRSKHGLSSFLGKMWFSQVFGIFMIVISRNIVIIGLSVLWIMMPFVSYRIGKPFRERKKNIALHNTPVISRYVFDLWKFFDYTVTKNDNFLPPDNRQFSPVEATAHRTSPTNIGLYLLSCLAMRDFGHLDSPELFRRLSDTLTTVGKLAMWHGHLYNWYDTVTLEVICHGYVSTVDSGNFIACLVALESGIDDYTEDCPDLASLKPMIRDLIASCDFSVLYDKRKKQFFIGYDTVREESGENRYDLFMSEARITSYYAIAAGFAGRDHWRSLGRPLISRHGHLGIASWNGTMFEYFMPALLLPTPKGSLSYEALRFALSEQYRASVGGLWGRSESGYYAFDPAMNYQYKAFGVPSLTLQNGNGGERVISPYSSFLALPFLPSAALKNLERMKKYGLYGEFGFYEACDFSSSGEKGNIIRSSMAHHTGMSIVSAANACFGNVFVRRFMRSAEMSAAHELLEEIVPADAKSGKRKRTRPGAALSSGIRTANTASVKKQTLSRDDFTMITAGSVCVIGNGGGNLRFSSGSDLLFRNPFIENDLHGLSLLLGTENGDIDLLRTADFRCDGSSLIYSGGIGKSRYRVMITVHPNFRCFLIRITAENISGNVSTVLCFEPVLCDAKSYYAHPAFADLSVTSSFSESDGILSFCRIPRKNSETGRCISVTAGQGAVEFATSRDLFPLMYSGSDKLGLITAKLDNRTGACIHPFCALRRRSDKVGGKYTCDFLIAYGNTASETTGVINRLRAEAHEKRSSSLFSCFSPVPPQYLPDAGVCRYLGFLLKTAVMPSVLSEGKKRMPPDFLWSHGISGDSPIVTFSIGHDYDSSPGVITILSDLFRTHAFLRSAGVKLDMVILYEDDSGYLGSVPAKLKELAGRSGNPFLSSPEGGIFLIEKNGDSDSLLHCTGFFAAIDKDTVPDFLIRSLSDRSDLPVLRDGSAVFCEETDCVKRVFSGDIRSGSSNVFSLPAGDFTDIGFRVRKNDVKAPWSYIYAGPCFGTILTQNSCGCTWKNNSRMERITLWDADALLDFSGERLILTVETENYDMCACASSVTFGKGCAVYSGCLKGVHYEVRIGCDILFPVKMIAVKTDGGDVSFEIKPLMDGDGDHRKISAGLHDGTLLFRNLTSRSFPETGFLHKISETQDESFTADIFLLGAFPDNAFRCLDKIKEKYHDLRSVLNGYKEYEERISRIFTVSAESGDPAADLLINRYLPLQTAVIRIFARCGFYQCGGAYGFRDQLQDSIAALYFDPRLTRRQIIRCSCRQYAEGDVMHWWHETVSGPHGIRSRCSDDALWLPLVTALYCDATGDTGLLSFMTPYVDSPLLSAEENERYEYPAYTKKRESVYGHCVRAIEKVMHRTGLRGLPLIGSGDWNDGMNRIGIAGKGESVWLAMFLITVIDRFLPVCRIMDDVETEKNLSVFREKMKIAAEGSYCGDRYLRAFTDDGAPLGKGGQSECAIDLLPQAFSVFARLDPEHSEKAMNTALSGLYDEKNGIFRLFTPPFSFSPTGKDIGYIKGYVPGVRENGGQYTHAAIWGALAFLRSGKPDLGTKILLGLNPARICSDPEGTFRYRGEPYFLAGDVLTAPGHYGRAGWTLYTGAAGWYYTVFVGEILGIKLHGDFFSVCPVLSDTIPRLNFVYRRDDTEYRVEAVLGDEDSWILDGKPSENRFLFDKSYHNLKITVEKRKEMV